MEKTVVVLSYKEENQSFKAFSKIKKAHFEGRIKLEQIAIVRRDAAGELEIEDYADMTGSDKTNKGGLIGLFVGILGGPFGILLGGMIGTTLGARGDAKEVKFARDVFDRKLDKLEAGQTGVMFISREFAEEVIDKIAHEGEAPEITRFSEPQLRAELEVAKKEAKAASK